MLIPKSNLPNDKKAEIEYPCDWKYTVIGEDATLIREALLNACAPATPEISFSHTSKTGKYHSFTAKVTVENEQMRQAIFAILQHDPALKMVI